MNKEWRRLDNAAKIFPSAISGANTQVFRFSCELKSEIKCDVLQQALDETIKIFDVYRCVMKRGLFWYYLEKTDLLPVVKEEYKTPCAAIYNSDKECLLFEVTYFNNRINLEVYHVLSDGTGAMNFLKTLVTKYLCIYNGISDVYIDYDASRTQMEDDSFARYYSDNKSVKKDKLKRACRLKGTKLPESRLNIITGHIKVSDMLKISHEAGVTITTFLCACLIESIGAEISNRAKKRDVVLSVPVNLRKYFPSQSARNFFSIIFAGYNFLADGGDFENIMKKIDSDLKKNLVPEKLATNINTFSAVEHNFFAKLVPLSLKNIVLHWAYLISMLQSTATVSNIGIVKMPKKIEKYIKSFDVFTGTNKLQICLCSYCDILSINFTSPFINTDIQRLFFRRLTSLGIETELYSNFREENDDEVLR